MYAELLEMNEEFDLVKGDGIPDDIESGWVAVAPVPKGKRCLAITHAASGIAGISGSTGYTLGVALITSLSVSATSPKYNIKVKVAG